VRALTASRIADQVALGVGSLLLARELGPTAFAPMAVLFVVNSLAAQVSDFGVGFAVLRLAPGHTLARSSLRRTRQANGAILAAGLVVALVVQGHVGITLAASVVVWMLSAESYIRKAAALKTGSPRNVATAEMAGAAVFLVGSATAALLELGIGWLAALFVVKWLVELVVVRDWAGTFTFDGARASSWHEWAGQMVTYAAGNVDFLIIGVFLSPAELSAYVVAFRLASVAPALLSGPITHDGFVEFSSAVGPDERSAHYEHAVRRAALLGAVGTVAVLAAAPIVPLLLGSDWGQASGLMAVLSFAVPWRMLVGITVALAVTAGEARLVVRWELMRLAALVAALLVAAQFGVVACAAAVAVTATIAISFEHRAAVRCAHLVAPRWLLGAACVASVAAVAVAAAVA
jgi:PST family polysaccharide transporter